MSVFSAGLPSFLQRYTYVHPYMHCTCSPNPMHPLTPHQLTSHWSETACQLPTSPSPRLQCCLPLLQARQPADSMADRSTKRDQGVGGNEPADAPKSSNWQGSQQSAGTPGEGGERPVLSKSCLN